MFRELCIFVALVVLGTLAESENSVIKEVMESCRIEQNITEAENSGLEHDWHKQMKAPTVERRIKCYLDCILQGLDIIDATGQVDLDKYMSFEFLDESMRDGLSNCRTSQASLSDPCEYAFGMYYCMMELEAGL